MPQWVVVAHLVVEAETREQAGALAEAMLAASDAAGAPAAGEAMPITRRVVSSIAQLPETAIRRAPPQGTTPPTS